MPSSATAGALSGAASGAAAGTAVLPGVGTIVGGLIGAAGGYLSGKGTQDAQIEANKAAALAAAQQSAQSFANYLSSRGINIQQLVTKYPDLTNDYNRARTQAGEKRDFNTWLYAAITSQPGHPIWNDIANPTIGNGAQNTTLPAWAVDANGNPLQPSVLNQLVQVSSGANNPVTAPIASIATLANAEALLAASPEIAAELEAAGVGADGRSAAQWLVDHITQTEGPAGGGRFTNYLRNFVATGSPAAAGGTLANPGTITLGPGSAGTGNNTTLDPAIAALIPKATQTASGIFDGTLLAEINSALAPVTAARSAAAGGIYDAEAAGAQGVHEANITKLADLLGVRREAAEQIYNASMGAAGGVRDARVTGANNIYGAELLRADTYNQAAQQALSRLLSEQSAERARRGFQGGSSGSDIVRARLNADYIQRGAGERAQAGVNLNTRLSDAGVGYATDTGNAGVGRATTIGQANEANGVAQLNAAVDLARSLGLAGVNRATTTATSNVQNAQDQLSAVIADQNRRTGSLGVPFQLAGSDLALKNALTDQEYASLDALVKRLNNFSIGGASGPAVTTATPGSVLNNTQIIGGTLSGIGSIVGNTANQKSLTEIARLIGLGNNTSDANGNI